MEEARLVIEGVRVQVQCLKANKFCVWVVPDRVPVGHEVFVQENFGTEPTKTTIRKREKLRNGKYRYRLEVA